MRPIVQTRIWRPAILGAALTLRTTYTPPNENPPYADDMGDDGLLCYRYRGRDPQHPDNRALRAAMASRLPLAYFVGIASGVNLARYPVWLVGEDPGQLEFAVAVGDDQKDVDPTAIDSLKRAYLERITRIQIA
jgi:putative restriction endonuclease